MANKVATTSTSSSLERLPESILTEILLKSEPETLATVCSVACVSRTLYSSVNYAHLPSISSLNLSRFSLDSDTFNEIVKKYGKVKKITLDCLRINESSVTTLLGPEIEELNLLKCSSHSHQFLATIGTTCPNLRVLTWEISGVIGKSGIRDINLHDTLGCCRYLESISINDRGGKNDYGYMLLGMYHLLPPNLKFLKLHPVSESIFNLFLRLYTTYHEEPLSSIGQTLTHLSLLLDVITDELLTTIAHGLPLLVELDLTDEPKSEPPFDLSYIGFQSLGGCRHLTSLSLIRSQKHIAISFDMTTDLGMFFLSGDFKGLESVRLGGFSKVTDFGYTSLLNSCLNLKKFEFQNGSLLTDLTFQDVIKVSRPLVEVKLVSCSYITSEAVRELTTCSYLLEVLDFRGCKRLSDSCLNNVSRLTLLTYLNLEDADVTDIGMSILGKGNAPISRLSLRGCKRVTDNGITFLLESEGILSKTLSSLDLSYIPGITDNTITTIVDTCPGLTELCLRNCFLVTDASVKALAITGKFLRRLDLYNCTALSSYYLEFLKKPLFRGLQWIGIGETDWISVEDARFSEICSEREWLTICKDGLRWDAMTDGNFISFDFEFPHLVLLLANPYKLLSHLFYFPFRSSINIFSL